MIGRWPIVRLGDVVRRSEETVELHPEAQYRELTVRLWGNGVVLRRPVSGAEIAASRRMVARRGQLIVSRIDARNGAIGIVPNELDGAIVSNDFPVFDLADDRVLPGYLGWMCRTATFVEKCQRASEGTTNRVRLQEDRFLAIEIPVPSLVEQERLVGRIEELASKIHVARAVRQRAAEEAERLYPECLAQCMEPHSEGWTRSTVADVIMGMDAGWSPKCADAPAVEGQWGVLKTTAVQWCEFRPEENKALPAWLRPRPQLAVQEGDVLVTRAGPRKRVGVVAAARRSQPRLTISDKIIRLRPTSGRMESRFLELCLASPFSQEHLVQRKTGLADAQVNISQTILRATPVAYPSLSEQRRIVAKLDALQAEVEALKRSQAETAAELEALLPAILDQVFKGEL